MLGVAAVEQLFYLLFMILHGPEGAHTGSLKVRGSEDLRNCKHYHTLRQTKEEGKIRNNPSTWDERRTERDRRRG